MKNDKRNPVITIIVAVMNAADTIGQCIESVARQTYPHKEFIIMDAGSTDGTIDILKKYDREITYWESKSDRGLAHAWNKAMKRTSGDWVLILGADDFLWEPDVLEKAAPALSADDPEYGIVYGRVAMLDGSDQVHTYAGQPWEKIGRPSRMVDPELINHQGVFAHKSVFERNGLFDESYQVGIDYEWLVRELKDRPGFFLSDIVVAAQRYGGKSSQIDNRFVFLKEMRRANKKNRVHAFDFSYVVVWTKSLFRVAILHVLGKRAADAAGDIFRKIRGKSKIYTK